MAKRYVIELLPEERSELEALVRRGKASARRLTRARALLLSDAGEGGSGWIDADIAAAPRASPMPPTAAATPSATSTAPSSAEPSARDSTPRSPCFPT